MTDRRRYYLTTAIDYVNSRPHLGTAYEKITADMERDYWMSAEEAVGYGIVSRIIERQKDLA